MYCPKCGALAPSDALKFCPRCGLPLGGVRDAMDREDGAQPAGDERKACRAGLRRGFKCLLWGLA